MFQKLVVIANVTCETPNRSERVSSNVVSSAPAAIVTGPIPLPSPNKVAASGDDNLTQESFCQ